MKILMSSLILMISLIIFYYIIMLLMMWRLRLMMVLMCFLKIRGRGEEEEVNAESMEQSLNNKANTKQERDEGGRKSWDKTMMR